MSRCNTTLALNAQGDQVQALQNPLTKVGLTVPASETSQSVLGAGTVDAIKQFQALNNLPITGMLDAVTQTMLNDAATVARTDPVGSTASTY
jgi:peptidoglycan hydrolase-like protein with peptidoglycan-binding domain